MNFKIPDTPEELFRQGKKGFDQFNRLIPYVVVCVIVLGVVLSSFYSIATDEVGIIQRFGKYARTTNPGLHWKLPFNIEHLTKVKVTKIFTEEFGFRTLNPGVKTQYSSKSYTDESLMLTGDLNVLEVQWIVQFRVKDPVQLLFKVRNPQETVRDISESVMRQLIGDSSVTEALSVRRDEINFEVQRKMQEILDSYECGIDIETVKLQNVTPPDEVKSFFNAVNEAKQEKERLIYEAKQERNRVIPKARGLADKTIRQAEGYAISRTNYAEGEAKKFIATWEAYKTAKDVTRKRLYLETLGEVLPQAGAKYIVDPKDSNILPLLQLNQPKVKPVP